jgi:Fe2+ transport system protein FeoA
MSVKKYYEPGDAVWIYGISRANVKPTKGTIIHSFTLEHAGYNNDVQYVISVPNEIEPLLEVRTWHNISQDARGPVGAFRSVVSRQNIDAVDKKLSQIGLVLDEEITMSASEIFPDGLAIKPKRRHHPRKKKL